MDDIDFSSVMAKPDTEHDLPAPAPAPKATAKPAAAPKATRTISAPIVESDERTALIARLKIYFATFPVKLRPLKPKSLEKLTDDELHLLNEQVGLNMGVKAGVEGVAAMVPAAIKMAEELLAMFTPLRIQGTHKACLSPDIQDLIKCACIDAGIGGGLQMTPLHRVALCLLITGSQQHMMNTAIEAMTPEQRQSMAAALASADRGPAPPAASPPPEDDRFAGL